MNYKWIGCWKCIWEENDKIGKYELGQVLIIMDLINEQKYKI